MDLIGASDARRHLCNDQYWCRWDLREHALRIPKRYNSSKMEDFPESFLEHLDQSLFIHGHTGSGKTHLSAALARRQVATTLDKGWSPDKFFARFVSVPSLLSEVKATFRRDYDMSEEEVFSDYANCAWLYLDDFGVQNSTDWTYEMLYRLIDHRWCEMLPTIISSNMSLAEMAMAGHRRIASRIVGMGKVVELVGCDRFFEVPK